MDMRDPQINFLNQTAPNDPFKNYVWVVYGFYLASFFMGITAIAGVIIAYLKKNDMQGTFYQSHLEYLIKTFWIGIIGFLIGLLTVYILIGFLILPAVYVWGLYRIIKGILKLLEQKPINTQTWF